MRLLGVFALVCFAGCTASPTLQELEMQAFVSGDWAQVEKREAALARRQSRSGVQCSIGYVGYCEVRIGASETECTCVDRSDVMSILFSQ
jgi:hypothetical protein